MTTPLATPTDLGGRLLEVARVSDGPWELADDFDVPDRLLTLDAIAASTLGTFLGAGLFALALHVAGKAKRRREARR
jgi:hypothetical protein